MKQNCPKCKTIIEINEKDYYPGSVVDKQCPLCDAKVSFVIPAKQSAEAADVAKLNEAMAAMQRQIDEMRANNERADHNVNPNESQRQLDTMRASNEELRARYAKEKDELMAELRDAQRQMDELQARAERDKTEQNAAFKNAQRQLDEMRDRNEKEKGALRSALAAAEKRAKQAEESAQSTTPFSDSQEPRIVVTPQKKWWLWCVMVLGGVLIVALLFLVINAIGGKKSQKIKKDVLNGFVAVDDAMNESNKNIELQLADVYNLFDEAMENDPEKVLKYYKAAQAVKAQSDSLKNLIDESRCEFLCYMQSNAVVADHSGKKVVKRTIPLQDENGNYLIDSARMALNLGGLDIIDKKGNTKLGTNYFYGKGDKANGKAMDIKNGVIAYKKKVNAIFADERLTDDTVAVNYAMNVEGEVWSEHAGRNVSWEEYNFRRTIAVADMVCLSSLKAEVMNSEYDAVKKLYGIFGKDGLKFDQVTAICRPSSTYIIQGGKYELRVNVGVYDSKSKIRAIINGQACTSGADGTILYTTGASTPGEKKVHGVVYMMKDGREEEYPFDDSYFVAAPVAHADLTKMNVVYAGIDNPISVSVPGVASKDVVPTIASGNATIRKDAGDGNYIINATNIGKITLNVSAKVDGQTKHMGSKEIRVKRIPTPTLKIGYYKSGDQVRRAEFATNPVLRATMEDFDFQLPALKITSFTFNVEGSGAPDLTGSGNRLTPEMISRIKNAKRGQKVYITDVTVKTPDGRQHSLDCVLRLR